MSSLARLAVLLTVKRLGFSNQRFINNIITKIVNDASYAGTLIQNAANQRRQMSSYKDNPECKSDPDEERSCGSRKLNCAGCVKKETKDSKTEEECAVKEKPAKPAKPEKCLYDDPACCLEKCPDANIRLDCLYYKMSDKLKRKYQQTWIDCPPALIKPKVVCQFPCADREPPLPKRCREDVEAKKQTACHSAGKDTSLMECGNKDKKAACIKIRMPGCRAVKDPPKCKTERRPNDCTKVKCPYPSYSECTKPKIKKGRPTECHCLEVTTLCDIYQVAKKKGIAFK